MNVTALYFSPTGGSKRSALSLAAAWLLKVLPSWTSPVAPLPGILLCLSRGRRRVLGALL